MSCIAHFNYRPYIRYPQWKHVECGLLVWVLGLLCGQLSLGLLIMHPRPVPLNH